MNQPSVFVQPTAGELELEERSSLRRVAGLSTELAEVTEVEYRQLRLERVVLVGVWTSGTVDDAENSLADLGLSCRRRSTAYATTSRAWRARRLIPGCSGLAARKRRSNTEVGLISRASGVVARAFTCGNAR